MKIAFVMDDMSLRKNGTTMSAVRYAEALRKLGVEVRMVSSGAWGPDAHPLNQRHIPIVSRVAEKQGFIFGKPNLKVYRRAFDGVDLVHLFLPFKMERRALTVARMMKIPVSAAFHLQPENITFNMGLGMSRLVPRIIYRRFDKKLYSKVLHVHCPSQFMADSLAENGYSCITHVISNGISDDFCPGESAKPFDDGLFHVLSVGRVSSEKDHATLIRAVGKSAHAKQIKVHIAGDGPLVGKIEQLGSSLPNPPDIAFHSTPDLISLMRACDLYVHPSIVDSEAIACIEAFACGLVPVISVSPLSAPAQFAIDDRSLFTAKDVDGLAARIDYWIENPEERKKMSAQYAAKGDEYRTSKCAVKFLEFAGQAISDDLDRYAGHRDTHGES